MVRVLLTILLAQSALAQDYFPAYMDIPAPPVGPTWTHVSSTSNTYADQVGGGSIVISVTVAVGSNRLLVFAAQTWGASNPTIAGITRNGQSFTQVAHSTLTNTDHIDVWYLVAPTEGTYNATITWGAPTLSQANMGFSYFTGIDQSTVYRATSVAYNDGTNYATTEPNLVVPNCTANDLVFVGFALDGPGTNGVNVGTQSWYQYDAVHDGSGAAVYKAATAGSNTVSYHNGSSGRLWRSAGVAFIPAP